MALLRKRVWSKHSFFIFLSSYFWCRVVMLKLLILKLKMTSECEPLLSQCKIVFRCWVHFLAKWAFWDSLWQFPYWYRLVDTETEASVLAWASTEEFVDSWLADAGVSGSCLFRILSSARAQLESELAMHIMDWEAAWLSKAGAVYFFRLTV